jgi:phosphorylcholine metabolism protein LicD
MTIFSKDKCDYKINDIEHYLNPEYFKNDLQIPMTNIDKLEVLIECLYQFSQFADKYNITYSIVSGSLLGAIRHEGIMPWDNDIDIAIFDKNNYVKINILKEKFNKNSKFTIKNYISGFKLYHYDDALGEIFTMDLVNTNYVYSGPYINNKPCYIMNYVFPFISFDKEDIFPLKRHKFENFELNIPNNYEKILIKNYNKDVLTEYRYNPNHNILHDSKYALLVLYVFLKVYTKLYLFKLKYCNRFIGNMGNRIMNKTFKHFK